MFRITGGTAGIPAPLKTELQALQSRFGSDQNPFYREIQEIEREISPEIALDSLIALGARLESRHCYQEAALSYRIVKTFTEQSGPSFNRLHRLATQHENALTGNAASEFRTESIAGRLLEESTSASSLALFSAASLSFQMVRATSLAGLSHFAAEDGLLLRSPLVRNTIAASAGTAAEAGIFSLAGLTPGSSPFLANWLMFASARAGSSLAVRFNQRLKPGAANLIAIGFGYGGVLLGNHLAGALDPHRASLTGNAWSDGAAMLLQMKIAGQLLNQFGLSFERPSAPPERPNHSPIFPEIFARDFAAVRAGQSVAMRPSLESFIRRFPIHLTSQIDPSAIPSVPVKETATNGPAATLKPHEPPTQDSAAAQAQDLAHDLSNFVHSFNVETELVREFLADLSAFHQIHMEKGMAGFAEPAGMDILRSIHQIHQMCTDQTPFPAPEDWNNELATEAIAAIYRRLGSLMTQMHRRTNVASKIVTDFRDLVNDYRGGPPVRLRDLLQREFFESLVGHRTKFNVSSPSANVYVPGPEIIVLRLIQNVLVNASEAQRGMAQPWIRVLVYQARFDAEALASTVQPEFGFSPAPGDFVQISISDNGGGIPPEHLPKIFRRNFTTKDGVPRDTQKRQSTGGKGLAIVHKILSDVGGFATVDSLPGKGTTFNILLPAQSSK